VLLEALDAEELGADRVLEGLQDDSRRPLRGVRPRTVGRVVASLKEMAELEGS
jgi:hypothetical protein